MRRVIAGFLFGCLAVGSAAGAVAAAVNPFEPVKAATFGMLNNRAVLGFATTESDSECTPDSAGQGCLAGEGNGVLGNNSLPVIAGVGAAAVAVAVIASSGSSSSP